ncbi:LysR family transcriptional regulator [Corallincola luteus]|uniref:LysR family transcriptional regulator n=1 Tax=Corallincola luteus TaxID=1775177 RepID=A0ABY2AK48_9GAMM|nr:LysR family transcriptional regulator [Corallincola luteus]TCI01524.1 LysR family transcriptional regulator [Corallincola luteus]
MTQYRPRTTLEQWRILQAVVDAGSYAKAAERLSKSQSSLNHAVAKMQTLLGVQLLEVRGRKAFLTKAGEVMLRRSRQLTENIESLENLAENIDMGWEPEIRLAVELIYPTEALNQVLAFFEPESRGSRINIQRVVLSGGQEAVVSGEVDLAIVNHVPKGYLGQPLCSGELWLVCHPDNPLNNEVPLESQHLEKSLQLVIRDTGKQPKEEQGWLKSEQRWTVDNFYEALDLLLQGIGFAWLPPHIVTEQVQQGKLSRLSLSGSKKKSVVLSLVQPTPDNVGPGTQRLTELFLNHHREN